MRVDFCCQSCDAVFACDLRPKRDCVYEVECPRGHRFKANVLFHEFQKHFEVAVEAVGNKYFREAIGSFAASYERFLEFFIKVVLRSRKTSPEQLGSAWKLVAKQSERQLGAFVVLFVLEFGSRPPALPELEVQLRNRVIHQGYFPEREECMRYGSAVLDSIREVVGLLYNSKTHNHELIRSVNDQGDFSAGGPSLHTYPYALIGTNRPPGRDDKTLQEMVEYVEKMRSDLGEGRGGISVNYE